MKPSTPMFSARHYEALARILAMYGPNNKAHTEEVTWLWHAQRDALVAMFKADNPSFNPERFNEACNGNQTH